MTARTPPPITPVAETPTRPDQPPALNPPAPAAEAPRKIDPRDTTDAADPRTAVERVVAYLARLGVAAEVALRLANTLDARIDPEEVDPARRTTMMLESFDRWSDELPGVLGMTAAADRVAFVAAIHLGRLLNQHPEALDDPKPLAEALRPLVDERPHGVLPHLPRQEMHRQPLGELPSVLQGEFWSGTYRWVVPVGASTKRMLRGPKKLVAAGDNPVAAEGPAAGE